MKYCVGVIFYQKKMSCEENHIVLLRDLWLYIFEKLPAQSYLNVSLTCKNWYRLCLETGNYTLCFIVDYLTKIISYVALEAIPWPELCISSILSTDNKNLLEITYGVTLDEEFLWRFRNISRDLLPHIEYKDGKFSVIRNYKDNRSYELTQEISLKKCEATTSIRAILKYLHMRGELEKTNIEFKQLHPDETVANDPLLWLFYQKQAVEIPPKQNRIWREALLSTGKVFEMAREYIASRRMTMTIAYGGRDNNPDFLDLMDTFQSNKIKAMKRILEERSEAREQMERERESRCTVM